MEYQKIIIGSHNFSVRFYSILLITLIRKLHFIAQTKSKIEIEKFEDHNRLWVISHRKKTLDIIENYKKSFIE